MSKIKILVNADEKIVRVLTDKKSLAEENSDNTLCEIETDSELWKKQREIDNITNYKEVSNFLILEGPKEISVRISIDELISKIYNPNIKNEWIEALGLNNYYTDDDVTDEELDFMISNNEV